MLTHRFAGQAVSPSNVFQPVFFFITSIDSCLCLKFSQYDCFTKNLPLSSQTSFISLSGQLFYKNFHHSLFCGPFLRYIWLGTANCSKNALAACASNTRGLRSWRSMIDLPTNSSTRAFTISTTAASLGLDRGVSDCSCHWRKCWSSKGDGIVGLIYTPGISLLL